MFAAVVQHPKSEPFDGVALGQHALVVFQAHRPKFRAETELTIPETLSQDGIDSESAAVGRFAQPANAILGQTQPASRKGLHFGWDLKVLTKNGFESLS